MTEFIIEIAGVTVHIKALFENTKRYCRDYLTEGTPDFYVEISQEDIVNERKYSIKEYGDGLSEHQLWDTNMERVAVYRKIVERIISHNVLLFHGSVVAVDGVAYLFTAKSGTGKSTHTGLWREVFGERAVMINDDKPLLKITEEGVLVCGTPWDGNHRLNTNCMTPLKAICVLERGEENRIQKITPKEALTVLLQQSHHPSNVLKYMELLDLLTKQVRFYRMHCNMDPEAAKVAYEGMQG